MKRIVVIMMMCLPMMVMAQQKKVAVYVTSEENGIDNTTKGVIGGELVRAIVKTSNYQAVERTADFLKQISKEQEYQHSGTVDDNQISALGKQFGVDYVCVANVMPFRDKVYIQARLIDVETATVLAIARETSSMSDIDAIMASSEVVANALVNPNGEMGNNAAQINNNTPTQEVESNIKMQKNGEPIIRYSKKERKEGGHLEYSCGGVEMDRQALQEFLRVNCPEAYMQMQKGQGFIVGGWLTIWCITGFIFMPAGYSMRNNAYKIYNERCARMTAAENTIEYTTDENNTNSFNYNRL